ncbi:hypothetical protein Tco_1182831 [Tanacetum coccineum]
MHKHNIMAVVQRDRPQCCATGRLCTNGNHGSYDNSETRPKEMPYERAFYRTLKKCGQPSRGLQQVKSLNIKDVKDTLIWEFVNSTSHDGETVES